MCLSPRSKTGYTPPSWSFLNAALIPSNASKGWPRSGNFGATGMTVFKDSPRHDWASHAADAFTYLAMGWRQRTKQEPGPPRPLYKPLNSMSYDELDDEIEITYNGTKIIPAERKPRRPDRV